MVLAADGRRNGEFCVAMGYIPRTAGIYWLIVCQLNWVSPSPAQKSQGMSSLMTDRTVSA